LYSEYNETNNFIENEWRGIVAQSIAFHRHLDGMLLGNLYRLLTHTALEGANEDAARAIKQVEGGAKLSMNIE